MGKRIDWLALNFHPFGSFIRRLGIYVPASAELSLSIDFMAILGRLIA